ncbi:MAG TPA: hypothetical protein VIJ61_07135 [Thermoanaerobaculia bacterium]
MSSLTEFLKSLGCTQTIYLTSIGRVPTTAPWNPSAQWNGSDTKGTFFARYGFYNEGVKGGEQPQDASLYSAGNLVGEALSGSGVGLDGGILQAIRQVVGDPSLVPDAQDMMDLKVVKDPSSNQPVYNTRFKPFVSSGQTTPPSGGGTTGGTTGGGTTGGGTTGGTQPPNPDTAALKSLRSTLGDLAKSELDAVQKAFPQGGGGQWVARLRDLAHQLQKLSQG